MKRGDRIYVNYRAYTHHGIDCGNGTVIHYTIPNPLLPHPYSPSPSDRAMTSSPLKQGSGGGTRVVCMRES